MVTKHNGEFVAKKRPKKDRGKDVATGNGGMAELMRELWDAAVNLRGSIEPADYKRYVLPVIFLRFLSLRYEKRRHQLELFIKDPGSDYFTEDDKIAASILDDPDEYTSVQTFVVPEVARWSHLLKHATDDDIKIKLDDALEAVEKAYPDKLRGLLPRIYVGSNLSRENVTGLINLFSKDIFRAQYDAGRAGGEDVIGRVYEYFIGEFANSEGKRGGEYFTPASIVQTLVAMLEPQRGKVFDPCCGSGGMFVQSDMFTDSSGRLSFYGQEAKDFTYRLCRMNLFIHGLDGKIELGNSYFNDGHEGLKADYILATPPFNDGAKGSDGWGADRIVSKDPRLKLGDDSMPLSPRNANTMWMLHFLHHLSDGGTAGFVMATGELSNGETARSSVRQAIVEAGLVDCVVQLTGQLFANTQIPCCLWFLSKNRNGKTKGYRKRTETLFIDGRKLGALIDGSRKQKALTREEIEQMAAVYREFRTKGTPKSVPGFCHAANIEEIREHNYALTPGRYVGAEEIADDDEPFEDRFPLLMQKLEEQFTKSHRLEKTIRSGLKEVADGV